MNKTPIMWPSFIGTVAPVFGSTSEALKVTGKRNRTERKRLSNVGTKDLDREPLTLDETRLLAAISKSTNLWSATFGRPKS